MSQQVTDLNQATVNQQSDYMHMTHEQLQQEHAELLEFNGNLDRERNQYRDEAKRFSGKVVLAKQIVDDHFRFKKDDPEMTLKAIHTVLDRCFES